MMRHLLGSDKKLVHDPGPKGESGEGDACLVMVFLVITAAIGILIYGLSFPPTSTPPLSTPRVRRYLTYCFLQRNSSALPPRTSPRRI